jgi:hypothetical protein
MAIVNYSHTNFPPTLVRPTSFKAHPRASVILVGIGAREVDATEADGANPDMI